MTDSLPIRFQEHVQVKKEGKKDADPRTLFLAVLRDHGTVFLTFALHPSSFKAWASTLPASASTP